MSPKNILPEMIDLLRKERDWTLEELGLRMDKSKSAISRWVKGDRSPMIEDLEKLASVFDTDIVTLLYGKKTSTVSKTTAQLINLIKKLDETKQAKLLTYAQSLANPTQKVKISSFPGQPLRAVSVIEAAAAGVGFSYGNHETHTLYTDRDDLKAYDLASSVSGDSMEPLFHDQDVILIKKNTDFINGGLYVIDYQEKSFVKKVFFEQDFLRLVSLNEKYKDIIIPRQTEDYLNIVGSVVDWFTPVQA